MVLKTSQKLIPSLQAPNGFVPAPVEKVPTGVRSAAFQRLTLLAKMLVPRTRSPSNAAV